MSTNNVIIGATYQDSMEPGRTIIPVDNKGTCKVFYGKIYHGKAYVPPSLLVEHGTQGTMGRIGFTLKG